MNRGYSGYYKGIFLRSSYEYAYAKYLDYYSIEWKYEERTFELKSQTYKPDFFIYTDGILKKIVEIKCRDKRYLDKAKQLLLEIFQIYNYETELITYQDLLSLYQKMPYSLNSVIVEWNNSPNTRISKKNSGENNPHFNQKHSSETKKRIGEHTRKLWQTNSIAKQRMLEGLRKSGQVQKGKIKTPRENRRCKLCNKEFTVLKTSEQQYCSQKCSGSYAIAIATEKYVAKRNDVMGQVHRFIIGWTLENKVIVQATPYNKISTTLSPMLKEIEDRFGVKDIRVVSKAVFGEDKGRKNLLKFMKSLLE